VPDFGATRDAKEGRLLTVRERMEEHRANPTCNSCHKMMDPIGLALEHFDVTGSWRVRDNGAPVDSRGDLWDGTKIETPADLRAALLVRHRRVLPAAAPDARMAGRARPLPFPAGRREPRREDRRRATRARTRAAMNDAPRPTSMPVVEARDLTRIYSIRRGPLRPAAKLQAVGGVTFAIEPGRTLAVVGESGCGKSSLARVISLIEKPSAGELKLGGVDAVSAKDAGIVKLRKTVQMVFQNPYGSLNPRKRIGTILEAPLAINTDLAPAARAEKARAMLARVGLRPEHYVRYPHMFSGGQRQRIAIARALMLNPALVVADEPVSALDVSVQAQVLNLLADLQKDLHLAYLFISHDLAVVRHIAHEVLVMYLGLAMEQGPKARIFAQPLHPYTQALLASTPGLTHAERTRRIVLKGERPSPLDPPTGCVFSTRCPYVIDRCRTERPAPRPVEGRLVACHLAEQFVGAARPAG